MTLAIGTRLGPYDILALIGAGGMGEVYRARDTRLGRPVAIKVLPGIAAADPERRRRFEQEARTVSALNHPNICVLHDIGCETPLPAGDGAQVAAVPFLVMELLDGATLADTLVSGPLPVGRALGVGVQIARGLAAAHAHHVVHRDLKPSNVFLTTDGQVKLLDFGIAKLVGAQVFEGEPEGTAGLTSTDAGDRLGTVGYMAPEQVRGRPCDERTDVFSFGCVLYELLAGRRAFAGDTAADTMSATLTVEPPALAESGRDVSPALAAVVARCLEKEASRRFSSGHDVALALEVASTSSGRDAPAPTEGGGRSRLRRLLTYAGLAVLALSAVVATLAFVNGRSSEEAPPPTFTRLTFRRGWVNGARFAPDGETVLYSAEWDGGPNQLFSLRVGSPESRALGYAPAELLAVSRTGELALSLDSRSQRGFMHWAGTLAQAPYSGGTPRPLAERVTFADWSPDGARMMVVRETDTGDQLEYPVGNVLHAGAHISCARVSPTGDLVAFIDSADGFSGAVAVAERRDSIRRLTDPFAGSARGLAWSPTGDVSWLDYSLIQGLSPDGRRVILNEAGEGAGNDIMLTYVRHTDGSPPMKLGRGSGASFSPDQRFVVAIDFPPAIVLYPIGPGQSKTVRLDGFEWADFPFLLPDGLTLVFNGNEPSRGKRIWVTDLTGSKPTPISPEGVDVLSPLPVTPDGRLVLGVSLGAVAGRRVLAYQVQGGAPLAFPGLLDGEEIAGWGADRESYFAYRPNTLPLTFHRVDRRTGQRQKVREITPQDHAGRVLVFYGFTTPDGRDCAYTMNRWLSELHLIDGVR
jgi:hypothetical protein